MDRREFIKSTCVSCGVLSLMSTFPLAMLQSCVSLPMIRTSTAEKNIVVAKSKLSPDKKIHILRNDDIQYDILLVQSPDSTYYALYMQCTHQDNALTANDKGLMCNAHGSTYDLQGKVTNGPATQTLRKYEVIEKNEALIINLSHLIS